MEAWRSFTMKNGRIDMRFLPASSGPGRCESVLVELMSRVSCRSARMILITAPPLCLWRPGRAGLRFQSTPSQEKSRRDFTPAGARTAAASTDTRGRSRAGVLHGLPFSNCRLVFPVSNRLQDPDRVRRIVRGADISPATWLNRTHLGHDAFDAPERRCRLNAHTHLNPRILVVTNSHSILVPGVGLDKDASYDTPATRRAVVTESVLLENYPFRERTVQRQTWVRVVQARDECAEKCQAACRDQHQAPRNTLPCRCHPCLAVTETMTTILSVAQRDADPRPSRRRAGSRTRRHFP